MRSKALATGAGTPWKILLGLLVVLFVGAQILTMLFAGRKVAGVVEPDYYKKGLQYGETLRRSQANRPAWVMTATMNADRLQVTVRDNFGAPVSGATARLEQVGAPAVELAESAPGVYRSSQTFSASELRGTVSISRGDALFSDKMVLFR